MTKEQFIERGTQISQQANVQDGLHAYFSMHAVRLYECLNIFDLWSGPLGDVLDIGPFYGYIPFVLRDRATSYQVLEGDDPAAYPLVPLYKKRSIDCSFVDLFEMFGPIKTSTHKLPFPDASFDTILCWETMEHFNFNPVKFIRELHRILRPGGKVCITVPNRASFQSLVSLLFGRAENHVIDSYYQFEDYESNGKKAFYGFHWREYTAPEQRLAFTRAGFKVLTCSTFAEFQNTGHPGAARRLARGMSRWGTKLFPRFGTTVYLVATK